MQTLFIAVWQFIYVYSPQTLFWVRISLSTRFQYQSLQYSYTWITWFQGTITNPFKYSTNLKSFHAKLIRREDFNAFNPKTIIAHNTQESKRNLKSALRRFAN